MDHSPGCLHIVSVPIGNMGDITLRAIEVLQQADTIICEDLKPARRLLHELSLLKKEGVGGWSEKPLLPLNEHTEASATEEGIQLLRSGKNLALISDAGTPLVADPGQRLVRRAIEEGIEVSPVPGASSILAALVVSGFRSDTFYFAGMLPREKPERKKAARALAARAETIVLLEAPYRLPQLLDDLVDGFGKDRHACIAMNLSLPAERVDRGTLLALRDLFAARPFKGEFVVVIEGRRTSASSRKDAD
ncbi:MAG TPA: 16S rRNA (cytidine(1402)-2'-O)-methyltransferase [Candidatus Kapabacteria bacterium]|nr:16S rRNA (cytidine(1402)-2'-O)-methyltransferase [Candidatus Kapabacteria bacterium]